MGGRPRIQGTRIRVMDVVSWIVHGGAGIDEYIEQFPLLTGGDVHAALAFYYDNVELIEDEFRDDWVAEARSARASGPLALHPTSAG